MDVGCDMLLVADIASGLIHELVLFSSDKIRCALLIPPLHVILCGYQSLLAVHKVLICLVDLVLLCLQCTCLLMGTLFSSSSRDMIECLLLVVKV